MHCHFVTNIASKNPVLSVPVSPAHKLAAVVWSAPVTQSLLDAQHQCLNYALQKLTAHFKSENLWLIAGHETWQPDNRITRHNRLWESLERRKVSIPQGQFLSEFVQASDSGIRYFGAIHCSLDQLDAMHAVMSETQAALVLFPAEYVRNDFVQRLVQDGWERANSKPPEEILVAARSQNGIVIEVYGSFDDPTVSVAAIGEKNILRDLFHSVNQ